MSALSVAPLDVARATPARPATLEAIYGPGVALAPCVPESAAGRWLPEGRGLRAHYTGGHLGAAGRAAVLCHAGCAAPEVLDLLARAGVEVEADLRVHRSEAERRERLAELVAEGRVVAFQHVYPAEARPPEDRLHVPTTLLTTLNDKAALDDLVPPAHRPRRRTLPAEAVFADPPPLPLVLKISTPCSTAGGADVAVCRTPAEFERARVRFADAGRLVVEEHLTMVRNLCLQAAVLPDGAVVWLGGSDQATDADGTYRGNWLAEPPPSAAVELTLEIVRRAAELGWRGVAGVDVAVLEDGGLKAFDLNFRVNGSTTALLLRERLAPGGVARLRGFVAAVDAARTRAVVRRYVDEGRLTPLSMFDPDAGGLPGEQPRLSALVHGADRAEVEATLRSLADEGLS